MAGPQAVAGRRRHGTLDSGPGTSESVRPGNRYALPARPCSNRKEIAMSDVAKIIEVVGSSDKSWADAADVAVQTASETLQEISGAEVTHMTAVVKGGKITKYKTTVKIAFGVNN